MSTNFTVAEDIFNKIEELILSGNLKKGEIISENMFSNMFSVSRTPVREAIKRLEQENLIKETSKGHEVIGISKNDIMDIYDIRIKIEPIAARLCAENISNDAIEQLRDAVDLHEFYSKKRDDDKVKGADSTFHEFIYKNTGSAVYEDILLSLHRKVQLSRKASLADSERAEKAISEHREIFNAIAARDGALAEKIMLEHVKNAKENITRLS